MARFVCNSEAVREAAIRAEDLPRERTVVLYNGIRTSPAPAEGWRPRHGVPADAPVVVCVSGMRPVKGVDAFVRAFALAARAVPGARAVLVGDGPGRPALEALVERLGLRERVHFDGWREDVRGLLAECQVAALASLSEGFSNALLEYMAAGLPSVVTRVGGNAEALRDGEDGILVEPGDGEALAAALTRLLQDGPLRLRMGQSAARRARERFDRDVMLDGMARILEEAIASCPR
ncbi:MAG: glycosyltransferase family 4 protein [Candidatus Eisenbacteria bacterium]|nr:glycosyltransferase family 4 protein [Candidatus Eisenbacteria bacterium]